MVYRPVARASFIFCLYEIWVLFLKKIVEFATKTDEVPLRDVTLQRNAYSGLALGYWNRCIFGRSFHVSLHKRWSFTCESTPVIEQLLTFKG